MKVNDEYTHVGIRCDAKEAAIEYLDSLPAQGKFKPTLRDFITTAITEKLDRLSLPAAEK